MTADVDHFVTLVREYAATVDRAASSLAFDFARRCAVILPQIYVAGLQLPDIEVNDSSVSERSVASPMREISRLFGRYDCYHEFYDPYEESEPVVGSLGDDLGDIYVDLADPLRTYDAGKVADAIWEWKFSLQGHAGDHLVDALRAIHRLVHDRMPPDYVAETTGAG